MAILHITFSLSTQGSIKHAIRQHHLQRDESVLSVNEIFSIGPLKAEERKSWLEAHIFRDNEERELYEDLHQAWKKKIASLPCDVDVWVWYSQSTHEEIGLRFIMSELINKCSIMVYGIDATEGLKRVEPNMRIRHTGELSSDLLMRLRSEAKRFSIDECQQLAKEWEELNQNPSTLRVWQDGIVHVAEDVLDPIIIECAERAHTELNEEWLIPMRIIGEIIGEVDDYLSEEFVENRLITLAKQGLFKIDGDTTDMYSYQVKYVGETIKK